ncbi:hypothetical protein ITJ86_09405 [Winogradskyella sp. F6397]|uniref:Uncharacterized protein n=1 Tax=Winogradskyella marina TaxID=2785530 RepID=A0ABS0EI28_9FLAO|nr:hypothetical protein [Winogradskyella marina]MBF8150112.1 hypothetical protein [Winogradskyella marina]
MKKFLILFISITTAFSCSKDDDKTDTPIDQPKELTGGYVVVEGIDNNHPKVYIDDTHINFLGELDSYKSRTRTKREYEAVSETELLVEDRSAMVSWEDNKVTITFDTDNSKYIFIKESSVPTAEEWVTTVDPVSKIQLSDFVNQNPPEIADLAYYNGYVYTHGHQDLNGDYVLTKINPNDFSTSHIPVPSGSTGTLGYGSNIEYVGSNQFWIYHWGNPLDHMYAFNSSTLEETNSIEMPVQFSNVFQLGSNGTDLYGAFQNSIRKWNFIDQIWGNEIEFGHSGPRYGLDLDSNYLYIGSNRTIHKYDLSTFKAVAAYDVSMDNKYVLTGFTLVSDNHLVASVYNFDDTTYEIVSIELP